MVAILLAGVAAGTINTIVGSGTLITFPTLLAFGVPPVTANVSNTVGLVPGTLSGAVGYRAELGGQRTRLLRLGPASLIGAALGRACSCSGCRVRRSTPSSRPSSASASCSSSSAPHHRDRRRPPRGHGGLPEHGAAWVWPAVAGLGVYGGYFGAAQGVLLMASARHRSSTTTSSASTPPRTSSPSSSTPPRGIIFIAVADVDWAVAGLIAAGSVVGGQLGATVGRRLSPAVLRGVIVVVGLTALVFLLLD